MKKGKKIIYTLAALGLFTTISAASATYAISDKSIWSILTDEQKQQVQTMREEKVKQMKNLQTAIEQADYQTWKSIIDSQPKITDYINESNFSKFSEMSKLMKEGKITEADAIRDELGLPDDIGMGGFGREGGMMRGGMHNGAK